MSLFNLGGSGQPGGSGRSHEGGGSYQADSMKSCQMLNRPVEPVAIGQVAKVAAQLKDMGFQVLTAQFGDCPSVTIKPCANTVRLVSVCTGQSGAGGQMYRDYAAVMDGVKVVWHKPMRPLGLN
ncbi:MAG: hypothetical protein Q7U38_14240 [Methylobacter sp.]|nr:hypothetical protein [Methylobacter sp.]MDP2429030.1 hypothetical protein [Methylobacter sp.]MDP3056531.1 hypothetical protein [Methylobacter sp.]MDP3362020.1 hypothetical protein [Methylobacter sp.]MDZ4221047.1 hypothetical protein [Methylobacter sp.]